MSSKRTVTASLLLLAAAVVVVALLLPGTRETSAYRPLQPRKTGKAMKVTPNHADAPAPKVAAPATQPQPVAPKVEERPQIDVVFALDTTGSMSGLIEGAKRKIWAMASQLVSGQPRPDVRIGLIGYRDLGDDYVTRRYALEENIDDVYAHLQRFRADGGGDTPEHVNKALADAIRKMEWRQGEKVLRLIFLVGDAPPHEGRGGLYSRLLAAEAKAKGIAINTVRCGSQSDTQASWKRIALASGGAYASIGQDGGMVAYKTPVDDELARLNRELSSTLLPTGSTEEKSEAETRAARNATMAAAIQAESAKYRARSGRIDSKDLLGAMAKGKSLDSFADEDLPAPVAALPKADRKAYVDTIARKRAALKTRIESLAAEREGYVAKQKKPGAASFDDKVMDALKVQGKRIGVAY